MAFKQPSAIFGLMKVNLRVHLLALAALPVFAAPISFPECPAVGHDTSGCELLITVTAVNGSGTASAFSVATSSPDLGPFDGSDDTLIGVLNSAPVVSLQLGRTPKPSLVLNRTAPVSGLGEYRSIHQGRRRHSASRVTTGPLI